MDQGRNITAYFNSEACAELEKLSKRTGKPKSKIMREAVYAVLFPKTKKKK